jgi:diaminopimelate epimerase
MKFSFHKMHGAGNDFVLFDDRDGTFPATDSEWLAGLAARKTGVGCDGIILVQKSAEADFRMRFFNPDGMEAEMCGNGARCVARLAMEIGAAPAVMTIETASGTIGAEVRANRVLLHMTPPTDWRMDRELLLDGQTIAYNYVNTGVPHVVVKTDNLDECDVATLGAGIRYHDGFFPAGANADFIIVTGPRSLRIRTYERGVEAETLACGTGIVAAALVAGRLGNVTPPVSVTAAAGDVLEVDYRLDGGVATGVSLLGPAAHVFEGVLQYS